MILAVLEQRGGIGGLGNLGDLQRHRRRRAAHRAGRGPGDALALASATVNEPLGEGVVAIGEVGLAGEVRPVTGVRRRLTEAARLGFKSALVPPDPDGKQYGGNLAGLSIVEVGDVAGSASRRGDGLAPVRLSHYGRLIRRTRGDRGHAARRGPGHRGGGHESRMGIAQ